MRYFRSILSHLTAALAITVAVILVIDMFFNSAMCFTASAVFKYITLALCACSLVLSQLRR